MGLTAVFYGVINRFYGTLFFANQSTPKICGVKVGPNMVQSTYKKNPFL